MLDSLSDPVFLVTIPFQEQSEWSHWRWKFQVQCLHSSRRCWRTRMVWRDTEVGEERLGRRSKWSLEAVVQVNLQLPSPPRAAAPHPAAPHPHLTELLHSFCTFPRPKKKKRTIDTMRREPSLHKPTRSEPSQYYCSRRGGSDRYTMVLCIKVWFLLIDGLQKNRLSCMKCVQLTVCMCNILYIK